MIWLHSINILKGKRLCDLLQILLRFGNVRGGILSLASSYAARCSIVIGINLALSIFGTFIFKKGKLASSRVQPSECFP